MKYWKISCCLLGIFLLATSTSLAQPVNDDCPNAIPIYDGDTSFSTIDATTDGPAHPECQFDGQTYHDIWYVYNASCNGLLKVSTCNQADYDTDLVVYDGDDCDNLILLGCNDDMTGCSGYTSEIMVAVTAGQNYLIRVGGYSDGSVGSGVVTLTCTPPDYWFDGFNYEGGGNGWNGEWIYYPEYEWWNMWWWNEYDLERQKRIIVGFVVDFPAGDGYMEFAFNWSTPQWINPENPPLPPDEMFIMREAMPIIETPGYYTFELLLDFCPNWVSVDIRGQGFTIAGMIDHECLPAVPNDDCEDAMPIGDVVDLPFDTTAATFDGPGLCQTAPNVWYCYTATCTGAMVVDTCGSEYDTKIAVYETCECDPIGPMLCCNDDHCCDGGTSLQSRCMVWVEEGREYLIEVGGFSSNTGLGDLTVQCRPADYYYDGRLAEGGGNGWPYPDGPGEWIQYPEWINMWWPNEYDLEREKLVRLEFDVEFPCAIASDYLEVVINWTTPEWIDPYQPPYDEIFIERGPEPPIYIMEPGHYELELMLPYCPAWVSVDVRGENYLIAGTIYHECLYPPPECEPPDWWGTYPDACDWTYAEWDPPVGDHPDHMDSTYAVPEDYSLTTVFDPLSGDFDVTVEMYNVEIIERVKDLYICLVGFGADPTQDPHNFDLDVGGACWQGYIGGATFVDGSWIVEVDVTIIPQPDTLTFSFTLPGLPGIPPIVHKAYAGDLCTLNGDLNRDGTVTLSDLAQLLANYGITAGATYGQGDHNCDGDVDLSDLASLLAVYGMSCN